MSTDFNETPGSSQFRRKSGGGLSDLMAKPAFKLAAVIVVLGGAGFAASHFLGAPPKSEETLIPGGVEAAVTAPTGEVTPEYAQGVKEDNEKRAEEAAATTDVSTVPAPMVTGVMEPSVDVTSQLGDSRDPIQQFEDLVREQEPAPLPPSLPVAPATPQFSPEQIRDLSAQMRAQMENLQRQWDPPAITTVDVDLADYRDKLGARQASLSGGRSDMGVSPASTEPVSGKVIVPAGSIYYGQMSIEANSDVRGPVMAQVLTGPFAGGKAIGQFEVTRDYLVIRFQKMVYRRHEYKIDALILDPDTTLGGVATEVDPRYFSRVILPAAASFIEAYGKEFSREQTTVSISNTGLTDVTNSSTTPPSEKTAFYKGLEEATGKIGSFLDDEASETKRLVRVAAGTPIAFFFVDSVNETDRDSTSGGTASPAESGRSSVSQVVQP